MKDNRQLRALAAAPRLEFDQVITGSQLRTYPILQAWVVTDFIKPVQ